MNEAPFQRAVIYIFIVVHPYNANRKMSVRAAAAADLPEIRSIIDANDLFPSSLLDDMMQPYLAGTSQDVWLVHCKAGKQVAAVAFASPEKVRSACVHMHEQQHVHGTTTCR